VTGPLFILGSGRCGPTYLFALPEKHPHIARTNEAHVLDFLWGRRNKTTCASEQLGDLLTQFGYPEN